MSTFITNLFKNAPSNINFNYIKQDLIRLTENMEDQANLDNQDFVYSIGLADYLPDRILKNFIKFCIGRLSKKGKFVITHKDVERCHPVSPDWFCDWNFYSRSENKLFELIKSVGADCFSIEKEYLKPSCIFFITLIKKQGHGR